MENSDILRVINDCITECESCSTVCIRTSGHADCALVCRDCADVCSLLSRLVARQSPHANKFKDLCIEICKECLNECEKHADHMESCKACAEACKACIKACENL